MPACLSRSPDSKDHTHICILEQGHKRKHRCGCGVKW